MGGRQGVGEVSGRLSGSFQLRASQDSDLPCERINDTGVSALGQIRDSENPDALGSDVSHAKVLSLRRHFLGLINKHVTEHLPCARQCWNRSLPPGPLGCWNRQAGIPRELT